MKIRVRFEKTGSARYVGHLDIQRFFQKAIRCAGIDIAYSQGFNPHQIMSFAAPLGLGMESRGEYFDMELIREEHVDDEFAAAFIASLNERLTDEIRVLDVTMLPEGSTNAMAGLEAASYLIGGAVNGSDGKALWQKFLGLAEILTEVESKKAAKKKAGKKRNDGKRSADKMDSNAVSADADGKNSSPPSFTDIRPLIHEWSIADDPDNNGMLLRVKLAQGSASNLRPSLLLSAFEEFAGVRLEPGSVHIIREDMFFKP